MIIAIFKMENGQSFASKQYDMSMKKAEEAIRKDIAIYEPMGKITVEIKRVPNKKATKKSNN